jgi:hypothetical protein
MIRSASSSMLMTTRDTNKKPAPRRPGFKGGPPNHCWRYMPWAKNGDGPSMVRVVLQSCRAPSLPPSTRIVQLQRGEREAVTVKG